MEIYKKESVVYLDYNATVPIDERVLEYMVSIYRYHPGNADSRTHGLGTDAKGIVETARQQICDILGISTTELIFTSGSTESNNMAILGLYEYAKKTGRTHFITTAIEHKSVLEAMRRLETMGCAVDYVLPDKSGRVLTEAILNKISEKTLLVSVMHANSETGIIQPVKELGEALSTTDIYFHVDATQTFGKLNDEIRTIKYNMLSFSGHKFGGPQGIGGLVLRRDKCYQLPSVKPLFCGGQQERGLRPGTTPVALVAGMAKAASLKEQEYKTDIVNCKRIKKSFMESIKDLSYQLNGNPEHCMHNTVNISFTSLDAEGIFVALKDSYAISNGSACNSGSYKPSYVLAAMGLEESRIGEAIRISWSGQTVVDFSKLVKYIKEIQ